MARTAQEHSTALSAIASAVGSQLEISQSLTREQAIQSSAVFAELQEAWRAMIMDIRGLNDMLVDVSKAVDHSLESVNSAVASQIRRVMDTQDRFESNTEQVFRQLTHNLTHIVSEEMRSINDTAQELKADMARGAETLKESQRNGDWEALKWILMAILRTTTKVVDIAALEDAFSRTPLLQNVFVALRFLWAIFRTAIVSILGALIVLISNRRRERLQHHESQASFHETKSIPADHHWHGMQRQRSASPSEYSPPPSPTDTYYPSPTEARYHISRLPSHQYEPVRRTAAPRVSRISPHLYTPRPPEWPRI
ncbi:hypothetical protein BOTBODRAFT_464726 [Botryobasidium botryosum FD-172 SS1]|uniref:Uncharacterized protein n=1 Tax=Botryobasidium botryosum (strain FD-172 SS1) TaxID=930990 RepID=A0A067M661_BOTB1|nr:hypothetical protein BOTBODRAFT_464726 [Botryobasidium botryosum FD-172 SS1]